MNGEELYRRVVKTVQEMYLKIGDSSGSVSLFYPFEGDFDILCREFGESSSSAPVPIVLERMPSRVRVTVPEEDCVFFQSLGISEVMRTVIDLVKGNIGIDALILSISDRYPGVKSKCMDCLDFDAVLIFPESLDPDVYCLTEEMGTVTYHRFSREDYLAMGFELPE